MFPLQIVAQSGLNKIEEKHLSLILNALYQCLMQPGGVFSLAVNLGQSPHHCACGARREGGSQQEICWCSQAAELRANTNATVCDRKMWQRVHTNIWDKVFTF